MWDEGWKLKRQWHELEDEAMVWGVLVERCKKRWVEEDRVVTVIRCVVWGVSGTQSWGGPTRRYFEKKDLRNNRCLPCQEKWEKEMWDVSRGKRMTRQCQICRKDNFLPTKE